MLVSPSARANSGQVIIEPERDPSFEMLVTLMVDGTESVTSTSSIKTSPVFLTSMV